MDLKASTEEAVSGSSFSDTVGVRHDSFLSRKYIPHKGSVGEEDFLFAATYHYWSRSLSSCCMVFTRHDKHDRAWLRRA